MVKSDIYFDTKIIFPPILSLILITGSQYIRYYFHYKLFLQLFYLPFIVYLFLLLVLMISSCNSKKTIKIDYKKTGFIFLLYLFISVRLFSKVWGSGYLSPLYEAQFITGKAHVDTLFHSAISNMLMIYGKPSIGVEGIVPIKYHYLIHLIIGKIGQFLNMGAWESFHLIFPVLILPILVGLLLIFTENLKITFYPEIKSKAVELSTLIFLFISISPLIPDPAQKNYALSNSLIFSESFAISISFLYLLVIFLLGGRKFLAQK